MNQPTKRPKLGKPIQWDEAELDQLAHVGPADVKAAQALWANESPIAFKSLPQADVIEAKDANSTAQ